MGFRATRAKRRGGRLSFTPKQNLALVLDAHREDKRWPNFLMRWPSCQRRGRNCSPSGNGIRFDVPVIGIETVGVAVEAHLRVIAVDAGRTLLLEKEALTELATRSNISIVAR
jgi:LpxI C-terminal domain